MEKMCDMYMCSEWSEARRLLLPLSFNFTVYHHEYARIQVRIRMNGNTAPGDAVNFPGIRNSYVVITMIMQKLICRMLHVSTRRPLCIMLSILL
jgi:hypothetical protein